MSRSRRKDPGLIASVIVQTLGIREAGGQSPIEILKKNFQDSLQRANVCFCWTISSTWSGGAAVVAELAGDGPES